MVTHRGNPRDRCTKTPAECGRRLDRDRCVGAGRLKHEGHEASALAGSAGAPDLVLHLVGYRPAQALSGDGAMGAGGLRGLYAIAGRIEDLGGHVGAQRPGCPVGLWKVGAAGAAHVGQVRGGRRGAPTISNGRGSGSGICRQPRHRRKHCSWPSLAIRRVRTTGMSGRRAHPSTVVGATRPKSWFSLVIGQCT
jgi:hypothetical protein